MTKLLPTKSWSIKQHTTKLMMVGILLVTFWQIHLWNKQQKSLDRLSQRIYELDKNILAQPNLSASDALKEEKQLIAIEKDKIQTQNAIHSTLVQALGGLFFLATMYFTWRNARTAESNLRISEEKQITEIFGKALEQLGSDRLELRLGAIYSLERIAQDSERDHRIIIEILSSFIRSGGIKNKAGSENEKTTAKYALDDLRAALTVIGRRNTDYDQEQRKLYLNHANLSGVKILEPLNLRGISMEGISLEKAYIANVDLSDTNLNDSNLNYVNSHNTSLSVKKAIFARSFLTKASLVSARLARADFGEADLQGADLSSANLYGTNFCKAKLVGANLDGANISRANFSGANLSGVSLLGADVRGAIFQNSEGLSREELQRAKNHAEAKCDEDFYSVS